MYAKVPQLLAVGECWPLKFALSFRKWANQNYNRESANERSGEVATG